MGPVLLFPEVPLKLHSKEIFLKTEVTGLKEKRCEDGSEVWELTVPDSAVLQDDSKLSVGTLRASPGKDRCLPHRGWRAGWRQEYAALGEWCQLPLLSKYALPDSAGFIFLRN